MERTLRCSVSIETKSLLKKVSGLWRDAILFYPNLKGSEIQLDFLKFACWCFLVRTWGILHDLRKLTSFPLFVVLEQICGMHQRSMSETDSMQGRDQKTRGKMLSSLQ